MTELGKQVWKKMEEMGWENAPEGFHLEYYENIIECTKQALTIPAVVGRSELLNAFVDFYNSRKLSHERINYDEIEIFLESI